MEPKSKKFKIEVKSARNLARVHSRVSFWKNPSPSAYIQITSGESIFKTNAAQRGVDVTWNQKFSLTVPEGGVVVLEAFHDGQNGLKNIGKATLTNLDGDSDQEIVLETINGAHSGWLTLAIKQDDITTTEQVQTTEDQVIVSIDDTASHTVHTAELSNVLSEDVVNDSPSTWMKAATVVQDYAGVGWEFTKTLLKRLPDFTDTNPAKATLEIVKTIIELKRFGMDDNLNAVERRIVLAAVHIQLMESELAGWKSEDAEKVQWMDEFNKTLGREYLKLVALRDQSKLRSFLVQEADAKSIQDILENINEARLRFVVEVGIRTFKTASAIYDTLRTLFFDRLTPSRAADHKSGSRERAMRLRACTPGTRASSLGSIISWAKDTSPGSPNVYWLFGPAGSGKSTIAYTTARRFEYIGTLDSTILLGGNFFCSRQSVETRQSWRIIPTIAYHLALICKPFAKALKEFGNFESVHHDVQAQIQDLLVEPWKRSETSRATDWHYLVVIDALDEIDENGGSEFLQSLFGVLEKSDLLGLKFFVTSRPDPDLATKVKNYEQKRTFHLENVDQREVRADIKTYLTATLVAFAGLKEINELVKLSDGSFIHAATVARYLEGYQAWEQKDRVKKLLSDPQSSTFRRSETELPPLDNLYHQILDSALRGTEEAYRRRRLDALYMFVCTTERTSTEVVAKLLCIVEHTSVKDAADDIGLYADAATDLVSKRHSVLYTENGRVLSYHKSFSDFLFNKERSKAFWCDTAAHHRRLAESCLKAMMAELKFNIADIPSSYILDHNNTTLRTEVERNISVVLGYSCCHWSDHPSTTTMTDPDPLPSALAEFLQLHALFWLEAMNLLELRGRCESMLRVAANWGDPKLARALREAASFALYFSGSAAASSTPHLYVSSLSTWPRNLEPCRKWKESFPKIPVFQGAARLEGTMVLMVLDLESPVKSVALAWDGSRIVSGSYDNSVQMWDASTGEVLKVLNGHTDTVRSMAFSTDGNFIVSGSDDRSVRVWDASTGKELKMLVGHTDWVKSVDISIDGTRIVSCSDDTSVRVWDVDTGRQLSLLDGHTDNVNSVMFSHNGSWVVSASDDQSVRVWDASTGEELKILNGHTYWVRSAAFSTDGSRIVSGSYDNSVRIWDTMTGESLNVLVGHTYPVNSVVFSNDGAQVVSGSGDRTVRVWDTLTGDELHVLEGHTDSVRSVAFSNDGSRIVSASDDKSMRVWGTSASKERGTLEGHTGWINSVAFSADGSRILSDSNDKSVRVWDASTGQELNILNGHTHSVRSVAFSTDGSRIVSGSSDNYVRIWDTATGESLKVLAGHTRPVHSVRFSSNGSRVVSGSADWTVRVWDTLTGGELYVLEGHTDSVKSVAFSNDGTQIVSGSNDETVRVWDASESTGKELKVLNGHASWIKSVTFSADGRRVVSSSDDRSVRVWDASTGTELKVLIGHTGSVRSVAFSTDGNRIVSGSDDRSVRIWDVETGRRLSLLEGHTNFVLAVTFSDGGSSIISGSASRSVQVWHTPTDQSLVAKKPRYIREHCDRSYTGWLLSPSGEGYLMFVPPAMGLSDDQIYVTLPPSAALSVDFTNASLGDEWRNCYQSEL